MDSLNGQINGSLEPNGLGLRSLVGYIDTGQVLDLLEDIGYLIQKKSLTIEELLPDLENYLRNVLGKEKLSALAEKRRKYYLERLDIVKFNPPCLPPRPDGGLMKIPAESIGPSTVSSNKTQLNGHVSHVTAAKVEPDYIEETFYEDMPDASPGIQNVPDSAEDMLYLMPADNKTGSLPADAQKSWSDSDSGTSYESYVEDDQEENLYDNLDSPEDVPLPRIQIVGVASSKWDKSRVSKEKKKIAKSKEPEMLVKDLSAILFQGELYKKKGSWKWNKCYCVISDSRLLVYKHEKALRPSINIVLLGYNITYIEKDGRRNHILRISHSGCETHFFSADLKEIVDLWLEYFKSASCTEMPSSGDSANLPTDNTSGSIAPDQHSMSTGSEGGSGDGVVSANTQQSPKSGDEKKIGGGDKDKKKKNILSDFLSGTFGKKKGQKMAKKAIDISDIIIDPQAKMAGVLDVCHETMTKNTWSTRYCCVKDGHLQCYYDNAPDGVELELSLVGADIQNAGKETKKELSIKLIWNTGDSILLDASDTIEQGKWLHALIMEREGLKDTTNTDAIYENQDVMAEILAPPVQGEDIYDEVYDVHITTGKGDKLDGETARALSQLKHLHLTSSGYIDRGGTVTRSDSAASDRSVNIVRSSSTASDRNANVTRSSSSASDRTATVQRSSSTASESSNKGVCPPPLPSSDPPKRPLLVKKRRSRIDDDGTDSHDEKDMDLSEEMASAFTHIRSQLEDGKPKSTVHSVDSRATGRSPRVSPAHSSKSEDNGVIKCHSGPTIAEDKELLNSTQNSILSVLRQEKKGSIDTGTLAQQIDDVKRQILTLKKQKSELRSRILTSRGGREKQRLEAELHNMDQMVENAEHEATKLQVLAQEKCSNLSRNSSFSSPSSSRSNSIRRESERPSTLKTSTTRDTKPNSPPGNKTTVTSPRETKASSLRDRNIAASKKVETKISPKSNPDTKCTVPKATSGTGMSKAWAKTSTTSNATKQAMAKFENVGNGSGTNNTKKTNLTSTKLEPLKVGTTRIRTVHTTTSIKSASPQGLRSAAGQRTGSTPDQRSNGQKSNGRTSPKDAAKPRKVVQERLKLWEAMSEDSSC